MNKRFFYVEVDFFVYLFWQVPLVLKDPWSVLAVRKCKGEIVLSHGKRWGLLSRVERVDEGEDLITAEVVPYKRLEITSVLSANLLEGKTLPDISELAAARFVPLLRERIVTLMKKDARYSFSEIKRAEKEDRPHWLLSKAFELLQNAPADKLYEVLFSPSEEEMCKSLLKMLTEAEEEREFRKKVEKEVRSTLKEEEKRALIRRQIEALRKVLGEEDPLVNACEKKLSSLPGEVREKLEPVLERYKDLWHDLQEKEVLRAYLELAISLPYAEPLKKTFTEEEFLNQPLAYQQQLEAVAREVRIGLEKSSFPSLLLLGPPGVGKTHLAKTLARSMARKLELIYLGGLKDEAEIKGHRRTYVGAMPGKVISAIANASTSNLVFLLDELDKIPPRAAGDPYSALIEVVDPDLRRRFRDLYLDLPYDLSNCLFIATANDLSSIPEPLLDRFEVIEMPGLSLRKKVQIMLDAVLPSFLTDEETERVSLHLPSLVRSHCHSPGARELWKLGKKIYFSLQTHGRLDELLETPHERLPPSKEIGSAHGVAWTPHGGRVFAVEAVLTSSGGMRLTGASSRTVLDSMEISLTLLDRMGITVPKNLHLNLTHIDHEKVGGSVGLVIFIVLWSLATRTPVKQDWVFTGEITAKGKVLPVGGIISKVLEAERLGAEKTILPHANMKELGFERWETEIVGVKKVEDVLEEVVNEA